MGRRQDRHQPVDGEAAEVGPADAGEVGGGNAGHLMGRADSHLPIIEHADDLRREQRAQLFAIGVGMAEVTEDVAAAADDIDVVAHFSFSLSRCSRSRTSSMSCLGVLIPDFDFFWKAWMTQISSSICKA